jgi:hypothetical protein
MQMRLRKIARESSEEIVVKCDCRNLGTFLALAGVGWLMYGAWIFRDTLFPKAGGGARPWARCAYVEPASIR